MNTKRVENELYNTLHHAEINQLIEFIRNRSNQVDLELDRQRQIQSDSTNNLSPTKDMAINGRSIKAALFPTFYSKSDAWNNSFNGENTANFDTKTKQLLADIKHRMLEEDVSIKLLSKLLQDDFLTTSSKNNNLVSLDKVVDVLQTDLTLPVSDADQTLLLQLYGTKDGLINIDSLLEDIDSLKSAKMNNYQDTFQQQSVSPFSPMKYQSPVSKLVPTRSELDFSSSTKKELNRLHGMSLQDDYNDDRFDTNRYQAGRREVSLPYNQLASSVRSSISALHRAEPDMNLLARNTKRRLHSNSDLLRDTGLLETRSTYSPSKPSTRDTSNVFDHPSFDNYTDLCERRLIFEISSHRQPEQALRDFIHWVMTHSNENEDKQFISSKQLFDCSRIVGLRMTEKEMDLIASGFASNGNGSINAEEFCHMIRTAMYGMTNGDGGGGGRLPTRHSGDFESKYNHSDNSTQSLLNLIDERQLDDNEVIRLLTILCHTIPRHCDLDTISEPFRERDADGEGYLTFEQFVDAIGELTANDHQLSRQDLLVLAGRFADYHTPSPLSRTNGRRAMRRSLSQNPQERLMMLQDWLQSNESGVDSFEFREDLSVDYSRFVKKLFLVHETNDGKSDSFGHGVFGWVMIDFELMDDLVTHLEGLKASLRRKQMIALMYHLSKGTGQQVHSVDGFTLLDSLMKAGFNLNRTHRSRILSLVEKMDGMINCQEFCQVLLNSSSAWEALDKDIVHKIVKAMGVTVVDRLSWLGGLKHDLHQGSIQFNHDSPLINDEEEDIGSVVSPSIFLQCLRNYGVGLSAEEEAALLDGLDLRRLCTLNHLQLIGSHTHSQFPRDNRINQLAALYEENEILQIDCTPFLELCKHHAGSWYHLVPQLEGVMKDILLSDGDVHRTLNELQSLFNGLDEKQSGFLTKRLFKIGCLRSRPLSQINTEIVDRLTEVLSTEGNGKVNYSALLSHLKDLSLEDARLQQNDVPYIIEQLLVNAMDVNGAIVPLRNWLLRNSYEESYQLNSQDMATLLEEFNIQYSSEDLAVLFSITRSNQSTRGTFPSNAFNLDGRLLMKAIFAARLNWTSMHPVLCNKIYKSLNTSKHHPVQQRGRLPRSPGLRGMEGTTARQLVNRLKSFNSSGVIGPDGEKKVLVDKDLFQHVLKVAGVSLTNDEILILADATDEDPEALKIHVDVLLDALIVDVDHVKSRPSVDRTTAIHFLPRQHLRPHATHASQRYSRRTHRVTSGTNVLNDLRNAIWKHPLCLRRSELEWIMDILTMFQGFDPTGHGLIPSEDCLFLFNQLHATVPRNHSQEISFFPTTDHGLVDYDQLFHHILIPPSERRLLLNMNGLTNLQYDIPSHRNGTSYGRTSSNSPSKKLSTSLTSNPMTQSLSPERWKITTATNTRLNPHAYQRGDWQSSKPSPSNRMQRKMSKSQSNSPQRQSAELSNRIQSNRFLWGSIG